MIARPIEIKDGPTAKRAVEQVLRTDDKRGGEAPVGWTQRRLSPTQVAVFGPRGTRRATLEAIVAKLAGGHVENQPREAKKGPAGGKRGTPCLVFDVAYKEPGKRGPKPTSDAA